MDTPDADIQTDEDGNVTITPPTAMVYVIAPIPGEAPADEEVNE